MTRRMMVLVALVVAPLFGFFPGYCPAPAWAQEASSYDPPARVGRVSLIQGTVSHRGPGDEGWSPAERNDPVTSGDNFWTEAGARGEFRIGSTALRLDGGTEIEVARLDYADFTLNLVQGAVYLRLDQLPRGSAVTIEIPRATIRILRAGSYHIEVGPGGLPIRVAAFEGEAEIVDPTAMLAVHEGDEAVLSGSDQTGYAVGEAEPTPFDNWSMDRDEMARSAVSGRYLSPEMTGAEALDDYGHWGPVPDYGPVWFPDSLPADWVPYRYGHWSYVQPWGWTWIDDAPWGFAPTHYGRWVAIDGRWAWVPGAPAPRPAWAPALVVFIGGAAYRDVGWFPLAPREPYIPPYRCSETCIRNLNTVPPGRGEPDFRAFREGRGIFVNRSHVTAVPREVVAAGKPVERAVLSGPSRLPSQLLHPGQALPGLRPERPGRGIPGPNPNDRPQLGGMPAPPPAGSPMPGPPQRGIPPSIPEPGWDRHRHRDAGPGRPELQPPAAQPAPNAPWQAVRRPGPPPADWDRDRRHDAGPGRPMPQPPQIPAPPNAPQQAVHNPEPPPQFRHQAPPPGWPATGSSSPGRMLAPPNVPRPQPPSPPSPPAQPRIPAMPPPSPVRQMAPPPAPRPMPQIAPPGAPHPQQSAPLSPGQQLRHSREDGRGG